MMPIALLVLLHAAMCFVLALYLWRVGRRSDFFLFVGLSFFLFFYGLPIGIGFLTGWINTFTILLSAFLAMVVALISWKSWSPGEIKWSDLLEGLRSLSFPEIVLLAIFGSFAFSALFLGAYQSASAWDAVAYHVVSPMHWAQTGRFELTSLGDSGLEPVQRLAETAPNSKGVLLFLVLSWTGTEQGSGLVQWPFLWLACAALYSIARRMNLPRWSALLALVFLIQVPEIWLQSMQGYADLQFLSGQLAVAAMCYLLVVDGLSGSRVVLTAVAFALLVSAKPTGLLQAGVLGIFFLGAIAWQPRIRGSAVRMAWMGSGFAIVVALCFMIAGPWYLHAWRQFGNPVYPVHVKIADHTIFPGHYEMDVTRQTTAKYQKAHGLKGWWVGMMEQDRVPLVGGRSSGLGTHCLLLGIPATLLFILLLPLQSDRRMLIPIVLLFLLLWLSSPARNLPRFGMYQAAIAALSFSWICASARTTPRVLLLVAFSVLLAFNTYRTIPSMNYRLRTAEVALFPLVTGMWRGQMQDTFPDSFRAADWWREVLGKSGAQLGILESSMEAWWARPLEPQARVRKIAPPTSGDDLDRWHDALVNSGTTHLFLLVYTSEFYRLSMRPDLFQVVFLARDSGMENPLHMTPPPTEAIFEVLTKSAGADPNG